MMTTTFKRAAVMLASCSILLTGCGATDPGVPPSESPTPSTTSPRPSPSPTTTKSADQLAAEKKVIELYAIEWKVLTGKSSPNALTKVARNQGNGELGFQQERLQMANAILGSGWVLSGKRPVTIVSSKVSPKKIHSRAQILVDVCEDDTAWVVRTKKGKKVKFELPKQPFALTLSVQKWPDTQRWYVTRSEKRSGTCSR